ncbi:phytanoyl-CoA dioxygenase family protein [Paenibacillus spongiae]|uniref:Phytanoyl-CoA dioxygenase family protein n=1 Tax=Paenibacillus spongiae TaxID=2909671 RepID=A0ABY5SH35_9BACL|nr:phytanoyl-CoA dioxygenase family protein [Paenibacillus spongiae]UVI32780.1 phytanoyl-CoA dioxygenase family protein [Paenibacillus spongiae]
MITKEHVAFFRENGYVKIEGVVPKDNCDRVIDAIWDCLGHDPSNPDNWYDPPKGVLGSAGMVEMYHHQSMWDNRQHPAVHQAFAELLGEEKLWVTLDRVNMKPPVRSDRKELSAGFIHWDTDTSKLPNPLRKPLGVQGVLYLADTAVNQGGFQCVPGIYRVLEEYLQTQPEGRNPSVPDLTGYEVEAIPGKAGDLVIWDILLPHGNGHNYADSPRYAQYISMSPARYHRVEERNARIEQYQKRDHPKGAAFPGDPRMWEQTRFDSPPVLTQLGRKLLGLDAWED